MTCRMWLWFSWSEMELYRLHFYQVLGDVVSPGQGTKLGSNKALHVYLYYLELVP